ncbi:VOC family protein [Bacillus mangrovi]|uniref:VOC family protein n=1 Tax=Metabacillus mangrovi TaxID=1491830 RepID=A0A7X2S5Q6_9BACI|nr:VOC family protein [Metabacillus mangrovi]MTH53753.1 VOC family protein [Metabacillus mangrovi]
MMLDHIVHFVEKPADRAGAAFQLLGFHTAAGGSHADWGTANHLCYFDLDYIEFLAVTDEEKAGKSVNPLIRHCAAMKQEGFAQLAIRTGNMDELLQSLNSAGMPVEGPFEGRRVRPDGKEITWRMLFSGGNEELPFFIEWGDPDHVRREELISAGALAPHPNGIKGIGHILIHCKKPAETIAEWAKWLQLERGEEENSLLLGDKHLLFEKSTENSGIYAVAFNSPRKQTLEKKWRGGNYIF